jgi:hypothetical protein
MIGVLIERGKLGHRHIQGKHRVITEAKVGVGVNSEDSHPSLLAGGLLETPH